MNAMNEDRDSDRYARCISASKRVRWDIDEDVIQGRSFDRSQKYLPDGLSLVPEFATLVQKGAVQLDHRRPGTTHPGGTRHVAIGPSRSPHQG